MELIFDSIEERDEFFDEYCPSHCALRGLDRCRPTIDCARCWEQSGVKYTIKDQPTPDNPVPIHMQEGSTVTLVCDEYLRPGDKLVCKDGVWGVERRPEMHIVMPRHAGRTAALKMMDELYGGHTYIKPKFELDEPSEYPRNEWRKDGLIEYIKNDVQATLDLFHMRRQAELEGRKYKPQIERVIFNDPATIVFWKDGTKTVVKCAEGDIYTKEAGLAMAICKKIFGDRYFKDEFKKWLPEEKERPEFAEVIKEFFEDRDDN